MGLTESLYIESATSLQERLARIDAILLALENRMIDSGAGTSNKESYSLDDGQVKISTQYRSIEEIANAITAFEKLRERILNKLNGRGMVLRPARGLI